MKNEDTLNVECTECGAKMSNAEFNQHQCPATLPPRKGESFDDYKARQNRWEFVPSSDFQSEDDTWKLKGTNFTVQVCTYGGIYSVNEDLLKVDGSIVFHKEWNTLDTAITHAEKAAAIINAVDKLNNPAAL